MSHTQITCEAVPAVGLNLPVSVTIGHQLMSSPPVTVSQAGSPSEVQLVSLRVVRGETPGEAPSEVAANLVVPSTGGVPIAGFTVTYEPIDCRDPSDLAGGALVVHTGEPEVSVGDLHPCTYAFAAVATNAAGLAGPTPNATTVLVAVEPAPPALVGAEIGDTETAVEITFAAGADGGAAVTAYTLEWSLTSSFARVEGSQTFEPDDVEWSAGPPPSGTITVNDLEAATVYSFRLSATSDAGTSPMSSNLADVDVLIGYPSAPTLYSVAMLPVCSPRGVGWCLFGSQLTRARACVCGMYACQYVSHRTCLQRQQWKWCSGRPRTQVATPSPSMRCLPIP